MVVMWRRGMPVLTIASGRPVVNAFGAAAFFLLFGGWSLAFAYLGFRPSGLVPFRPLWTLSAESRLVLAWTGIVLAVAAQVVMWCAIVTMGSSWRIGIDDGSPGPLVTRGIFRVSRNPIFCGMDAAAVAAFLIHPNGFFLACAVWLLVGTHMRVLKEERHLARTYGEEYARYRARTPRYVSLR
jgi:protein-S-isoprenylcysteine O-methyltransferase Ste14